MDAATHRGQKTRPTVGRAADVRHGAEVPGGAGETAAPVKLPWPVGNRRRWVHHRLIDTHIQRGAMLPGQPGSGKLWKPGGHQWSRTVLNKLGKA